MTDIEHNLYVIWAFLVPQVQNNNTFPFGIQIENA